MAELMVLMLKPPAPCGLQLGPTPTPTPIDIPIGTQPIEFIELYVGAMLPMLDIVALVMAPASPYSFCDWSMVIELAGVACCRVVAVKRES
jgi:hypothetical protein